MGAVLSQVHDEAEWVPAYYSKTFTLEQRNYCVTRKELLAVVKALKHFGPHLFGREFKVRADHASLVAQNIHFKWTTGEVETLAKFNLELEFRRSLSTTMPMASAYRFAKTVSSVLV